MDFSRDCLDKNSEFGVLWYYGNKEGKIVPKDVEKLNMKILYEFIQIHKGAIQYEHWTILLKGFFVIMLNRLELINRQFKALNIDLKNQRKPTLSEFKLIYSDQIDLNIEPPKERKINKKIVLKNKQQTLIKEESRTLLNESDFENLIVDDNQFLQDDGFGGDIASNVSVNVDEYFDLLKVIGDDHQIEQQTDHQQTDQQQIDQQQIGQQSNLAFTDDLEELDFSPIKKVDQKTLDQLESIDDTTSFLPVQSRAFVQDGSSLEQQLLSERRSQVPSSIGDFTTIKDQISQEDLQPSSQLASQAPSVQSSQHGSQQEREESLMSFDLNAIDEQDQQRRRTRRRQGLIIDTRIEFNPKFHGTNQKYHDKHVQFNLAIPILPVDKFLTRPLIPSSIEPIVNNYYTTEHRNTDELIIREIPDDVLEEDDQQKDYLSDIGSPAFSQHEDQFTSNIIDDFEIEQISKNLLDNIVDQVVYETDRPQMSRPVHDSLFESDVEMLAHGASNKQISRRYFSDFESVAFHSATTSRAFDRRDHDLDSLASYRIDETAAQQANHNLSVLSELSISYIDTILDILDDNNGETTFSELTNGFRKREAAKFFADLLTMKMRGEIELIQFDTTNFDEIYIKKI